MLNWEKMNRASPSAYRFRRSTLRDVREFPEQSLEALFQRMRYCRDERPGPEPHSLCEITLFRFALVLFPNRSSLPTELRSQCPQLFRELRNVRAEASLKSSHLRFERAV